MSRDARALGSLPGWLWTLLAVALAGQIALHSVHRGGDDAATGLAPPPTPAALRLASFGEPAAAARITMLYLQAFDGAKVDYPDLIGWLRAVLALDPRSEYPLFTATRVFAEVPDTARARLMLDFIHEQYLLDPNRRWPWLAHAALLAKHRLHDLPLALRYAAAIDRYTTAGDVPLWAKQMQIFILEDMNELEAARVLLGGLLESGKVRDADEARFLRHRLEELERRTGK